MKNEELYMHVAAGCIFAELSTGKPLFPGKTAHDQLWLILKAIGRLSDKQVTQGRWW
jgi:mitogen-activated protein kinase 1/3